MSRVLFFRIKKRFLFRNKRFGNAFSLSFRQFPVYTQKILAFLSPLWYNIRAFRKSNIQGYSSAGRVAVSKTVGRGFESFCPCQTESGGASRLRFQFGKKPNARWEPMSFQTPRRMKTLCATQRHGNDKHGWVALGSESFCPCQQKRNFCLPKVPFLFIQAAGLVYHRRMKCGAYHQGRRAALVSHHAPACILPAAWWYTTLRVGDIQCYALMIYTPSAWLGREIAESSWITLQNMIKYSRREWLYG